MQYCENKFRKYGISQRNSGYLYIQTDFAEKFLDRSIRRVLNLVRVSPRKASLIKDPSNSLLQTTATLSPAGLVRFEMLHQLMQGMHYQRSLNNDYPG